MSLDDAAFEILQQERVEQQNYEEAANKRYERIAETLKQKLLVDLGIIATEESALVDKTINIIADGCHKYVSAKILFTGKKNPHASLLFTVQQTVNTQGKYMVLGESTVIITGQRSVTGEELSKELLLPLGRFLNCIKSNKTER